MRKERFAFAALSGEDVLSLARRRAWGLEVPWRVRAIRVTSVAKSKADASSNLALKSGHSLQSGQGEVRIEVDPSEKGKRKPGKKRRIILRERQRKGSTERGSEEEGEGEQRGGGEGEEDEEEQGEEGEAEDEGEGFESWGSCWRDWQW